MKPTYLRSVNLGSQASIISLGAVFLFLCLTGSAQSQTTGGASTSSTTPIAVTNAPTATPPVAVSLPNVVSESESMMLKLNDLKANLDADPTLQAVETSLPAITREIDEHQVEDAKMLSASNSLTTLRTAQRAWETLGQNLNVSKKMLVDRLTVLDGQVNQLKQWQQTWQATLALAKSSTAPPDILTRATTILAELADTIRATQNLQTQTLSEQSQVAEQGARIQDALAAVQKAQASAVGLLFTRDSAPLWDMTTNPAPVGEAAAQKPFTTQLQTLEAYIRGKASTLLMHLLGFVLLAAALIWIRREVDARAKDDPALEHVARVFDVPIANAALIALLVSVWLYPLAPRLFLAAAEAAALCPAVIILRRLIQPSLFVVLYAMVLFYIFDQLRYVTSALESVSRTLFIFELLVGALFLAWLIRFRRGVSPEAQHDPVQRIVRVYGHVALLLFVFSGMSNVLGYVHLAILVGNATLSSSYLAVILYAAVRVADAVTLSVLQVPPVSRFGLVRRHHALLAQTLFRLFRWGGAFFWAWETLDLFAIRTLVWAKALAILLTKIGWGSHVISLGDILAFCITVWASFFISKVIRFVLEEEIFPHLQLPPGVPYTASTLAHYLVLILGFFAALEFLGIRLSNFAVLAGAFGVGLGFGLQNIMNNFVSGIILLFERPIKVGDIIQVDTAIGTVESIGIRASVIRLTNGSEVIVPNGNLISNQVTNWTFSNRQRMVDIPVTVVSKTDPQRVIALLVKCAQDHPLVLKDPAPQAVVTTFTAAALTLELRVWTNHPDQWTQIRSDLSVAINAAFLKENIAIG